MDGIETQVGSATERPLPAEPAPRRPWAQRALAAAMRHRSSRWFYLLAAIVTVGFAYLALKSIKLSLAWAELRRGDWWWLIAAMLAFCLGTAARALRWRALFARGRRPPAGTVGNAMMVGYLYNNIMPARAGEAARVMVLTQRSNVAPVEIVGTVVLERVYDVVTILVLFFAAEPLLPSVSWFGTAAVVAIVLAVAIVLVVIVLAVFGDRPVRAVLRPLQKVSWFSGERIERTVDELVHGLSGLRHPLLALEAFVLTVIAWMFTALCAYVLSVAFHMHLPFAAGLLVAVAIGVGNILPSPPAAVGVFEGATLIALRAYHVPTSTALPYAVVLHLVNFVPFLIAGAVLLHHNSRHPVAVSRQDPQEPVAG